MLNQNLMLTDSAVKGLKYSLSTFLEGIRKTKATLRK
jgi:hypothetical protein